MSRRSDGATGRRSATSFCARGCFVAPPLRRLVAPLLAALLLTAGRDSRGADPVTAASLTDEHVRQAIAAIVGEIHDRKTGRRFWDPKEWDDGRHGSIYQKGGYTALTTLALMYAGESYQDPRLQGPIEHLAASKFDGTYAVAVRASLWARLPDRFAPNLAADTQWLLDGFSDDVGGWAYDQRPRTRRRDNSIRQFGALALWESAKRDIEVPTKIWRALENAFLENQLPDGGWNYKGEDTEPPTGSMTAAGLATLFITQEQLHAERAVALSAVETKNQAAIDRGLAWMDANFSPTENPGSFRDFYYYLYGVERVGLASGVRQFGGQDWYRLGAAEILRRLCTWDESGVVTVNADIGGSGAPVQVWHLDFALMFLSRGRVPVAINKLIVDGHRTNNRPRDAANLARWLSDRTESEMSWQKVGFDTAPETWLDAPLLYLASHAALPWAQDLPDTGDADAPIGPELARLKRYLDLGGMVLAVNEGNSRAFATSVVRVAKAMYPSSEWRTLEADHWAYTIHAQLDRRRPVLKSLSNGVRELIVLAPNGDIAADFQRGPDGKDAVKRAPAFDTASNLYFYKSEMNRPRPRLARHAYPPVAPDPDAPGTITVVRARHGGNWNPEPAALDVLRSYLRAEHDLGIGIATHPLDAIDDLDPPPALVVVSGTDACVFTSAEHEAVGAYARRGGVVLFETPGGTGAFTQGAEEMAATIFTEPIASLLRDPVITGKGIDGAADLFRLEYRPYAFEVFGTRETIPRLRGITIDGAPRVLFSREDISHALLDQPCWGVSGYRPDSARLMMANIVRHAARPARVGAAEAPPR